MSSDRRGELVREVRLAVQAFQDSTDAFDEAAAARLGINRTDLRCLSVIAARGLVAVGEIARAISLTRGAATTALDRIERKGYARRVRDPNDRRGVLMEMTDKARADAGAIWAPVVSAGERMIEGYTEAELETVLRYLREARSVQLENLPQSTAGELQLAADR